MNQNRKKLLQIFSTTDGVFQRLRTETNIPWGNSETLAARLDFVYLYNHSGERYVSPILNREDSVLTTEYKNQLIDSIFELNKTKWTKLWAITVAEYNPIENYSMTEEHTGTETRVETPDEWTETETQTPTNWKTTETQTPTNWKETKTETPTDWKETKTDTPTDWTETQTQTPTNWVETTEGLKADNEQEQTSNLYAFNSASPVPTSKDITQTKDKHTKTQAGTYETATERTGTYESETERSGTYETETEQSGTFQTENLQTGTFVTEQTRTGTYENETTYNTTLTRSGNIGTVTAQDMIEQEISLWQWNFFEMVFKDLDKILTLDTY